MLLMKQLFTCLAFKMPKIAHKRLKIIKNSKKRFDTRKFAQFSLYQTYMFLMAPLVGLEPTTLRLTAECSTD